MTEEKDQPQPVDLLPRLSIGTGIEMVAPDEATEAGFIIENPILLKDPGTTADPIMDPLWRLCFKGQVFVYSLLSEEAKRQGKKLPIVSDEVNDVILGRFYSVGDRINTRNYRDIESQADYPVATLEKRIDENPNLYAVLEGTFNRLAGTRYSEDDILIMRLNAVSTYEALRLQAQVDLGIVKLAEL